MLTKKARLSIFGILFSQIFEKGDVLNILKDLQEDDKDLATFSFKMKWEKVLKILTALGSWVDRFEATELIEVIMKAYKVNNKEIWESVIFTDQTIYMWEKEAAENRQLDLRDQVSAEKLFIIEQAAYVRAIISAYMIDSKILQLGEDLKRLDYVFQQEVALVAKKIKDYRLPINLEEFIKHLKLEMPFLKESHFQFVRANYSEFFASWLKKSISGKEKRKAAKSVSEPAPAKAPAILDEDNVDSLFDSIVIDKIPDMEVREAEPIIKGDQTVLPQLHTKIYKIDADGVTQLLLALIEKFGLDEISERTLSQLWILQRHVRQTDQISAYWKILNQVERRLLVNYHQLPDSEEKEKLNKIIQTLLAFKIRLGNDTARLESLKKEHKN
ncbi:MAG TPA: hypothetical protein ENN28_03295 [Candidatus Uhrbacteria bacterium]|nr:hypothetical protein [Candidatus Uhrbacteria bacterium]